MNNRIGVFLDQAGQPTTLFDSIAVKVYEKQDNAWTIVAEYPVSVDMNKGMQHVRAAVGALLIQLGETKVIVGSEMAGIVYSLFQQANFHVFETTEAPEVFLDEILSTIEEAEMEAEKGSEDTSFLPQQVNELGDYFVDLKELQIKRPGLTSKQALLPFLKEKNFRQLEIECAHVPKWFDQLLTGIGLEYEAVELGHNDFKVRICIKR